jgi:hypothetical protein
VPHGFVPDSFVPDLRSASTPLGRAFVPEKLSVVSISQRRVI